MSDNLEADIFIVGESWGKDEAIEQRPFVGYTGKILRAMLHQIGVNPSETYMTNVFNLQPQPNNDIKNLCGPREEAIPDMPFLQRGKYVSAEYASELERLQREIDTIQPNVIVAAGATAAWALCHTNGIKSIRGAPLLSFDNKYKVLPTYHPSAVARDWRLRPIVISDLMKAKAESLFPEIVRPRREIWIEPTLDDIARFARKYIEPSPDLSIDIETIGTQITCIGFAPTPQIALVIPFYDPRQSDGNYWRREVDEIAAWDMVRHFCSLDKAVVGQNFLYDCHFLWKQYGITVPGMTDDTMLLHHAMQPEMEKSLSFLASIYTNEAQWKFMGRGGTLTRKKED